MNRSLVFAYQLLTGLSDSSTGALLFVTPALTLRLMGLYVASDALVYVSFVGAFVLSVGFACFYGALLAWRGSDARRLETVWLLTAITRASVAIFVAAQVLMGTLSAGWLSVAAFDAACVIFQAIGLRNDWLCDAAE